MSNRIFIDALRYKDVFLFLGWRDILVRYKQTVVGTLWVILRPLLTVIVFTVVFSKIAGLTSIRTPYPLLVLSGILPWQFFSDSFSQGSLSFIANSPLVCKVYIPRIIIPSTPLVSSLLDFCVGFLFFMGSSIFWYGFFPTFRLIYLPLCLCWLTIVTWSLSILFSTLIVFYRDFRHVVPFLVQFGLYCSPIGFSSSLLSSKYRLVLSVNPFFGIIDFFRWALVGEPLFLSSLIVSLISSFFILGISILYFMRVEAHLADSL